MGGFFLQSSRRYEANSSINIKEAIPDGAVFDSKPKRY